MPRATIEATPMAGARPAGELVELPKPAELLKDHSEKNELPFDVLLALTTISAWLDVSTNEEKGAGPNIEQILSVLATLNRINISCFQALLESGAQAPSAPVVERIIALAKAQETALLDKLAQFLEKVVTDGKIELEKTSEDTALEALWTKLSNLYTLISRHFPRISTDPLKSHGNHEGFNYQIESLLSLALDVLQKAS